MREILALAINEFLPTIIYIIAGILFTYIGMAVRKYLPIVIKFIKAHTTVAQQKLIEQLGKKAFVFAETVFKEKKGNEKLHEAVSYFEKHLDSHGLGAVNLSYNMVRNAIEQAWLADKSLRTFDFKTAIDEIKSEEIKKDEQIEIEPDSNEILDV